MDNEIGSPKEPIEAPYDATHLSDVIEAIKETDPDFRESSKRSPGYPSSPMLNGGGQVTVPLQHQQQPGAQRRERHPAEVRIIEQPASKALRFRYECEGRSAGSIPGASSTPENKTFPEIQICGYHGRAVVVVSCVTKDEPYLVHPHNLVGKECKNGVCTVVVSPETMRVQFQNLGIQCVKKRDIESSLRLREQIKVDPFRQGYSHRNQPTSIDLNAVRLCFQTYLENPKDGKYSIPLRPVVSDVIYDKKAMADLSIVELCSCVSPVDGGRQMILLCEKVAKEDIEVHFYEEDAKGMRIWQAKADFQPSQVHKQTAITFKTPPYRSLDVSEPVKVFIQLYRPSDRMTSESRPFEYLPLDAGRIPYWSFRRGLLKKTNYDLFDNILANDAKLVAKRQLGTVGNLPKSKQVEANNNDISSDYAEVKKSKPNDDDVILVSDTVDNEKVNEEKSFNEIINQVAELDEIYSETHIQLFDKLRELEKPPIGPPQDESFDDARTYTSLQLAFKNPVDPSTPDRYEDVIIQPISPKIDIAAITTPKATIVAVAPKPVYPPPHKRDEDNSLPPLPPKRSKKIETYIGGSMSSIQLSGKQADILLTRSGSMKSTSVSRTQSFNMQRPKSQSELVPPGKRLPPVPNASATLPNPKKRGFFSKLFGRRSSKTSVRAPSREPSVTPSYNSTRSLKVENTLSKSSGNISTHSSNSIRIRLKDESPPPITGTDSFPLFIKPTVTIAPTVAPATAPPADEDMDLQLDLTEAENYALYTAMAPHATQSEFDEFSCYYAPVEGGKLLTNAEVAARMAGKT